MIHKLSIKGFKSIRQLDLSCRRVNVFIGEPNTGKTNILEAIGLWCGEVLKNIPKVLRTGQVADLFWDQNTQNPIEVRFDGEKLSFAARNAHSGRPCGSYGEAPSHIFWFNPDLSFEKGMLPTMSFYYLFNSDAKVDDQTTDVLLPPYGENITTLLYGNKASRQTASSFFKNSGYRLHVDQAHARLLISKEVEDVLMSFPYSITSETLRRMVFYHLALDTNRDTVLAFDEPEAHSYPPYTKLLAERIASDDRGNQFFLTTHSPYMLDSLLSKTPAADLNVVLCRMENFETKTYPLNEAQIGKLMEWSMDAFFNFDRLLDSDA